MSAFGASLPSRPVASGFGLEDASGGHISGKKKRILPC